MSYFQQLMGVLAGGSGLPVPANNRVVLLGDSRTANNTENAALNATPRLTANGYAAYLAAAADYRAEVVGNYGINADTIDGLITRLTAQGTATGSSPTWRGQILVNDPGLTAGIAIVLIGVNNTTQPIGTTAPKYDQLLTALIDAGKVVVLMNELPNSDQSGQGAVNLARRAYLDNWPWSSTTLTDGQKATYAAKTVRVNVYDEVAQSPTSYFPKAGYYPVGDLLHPNGVGHRVVGETVAIPVAAMLSAAGYAARNALPATDDMLMAQGALTGSTAITSTNGETAGAGGANMDGNGQPCVTGAIPTGWRIVRGSTLRTLLNAAQPVSGSQLSVVATKGVGADGYDTVTLRLTGQVGTSASTYSVVFERENYYTTATIGSMNGSLGIVDGDTVRTIANVDLAADPKGLVGFAVTATAQSTSFTHTTVATHSTVAASDNKLDGMARYQRVLMSPGRQIPTGFVAAAETKTINTGVTLTLAGGTPIDITLTLSRVAMVKNR